MAELQEEDNRIREMEEKNLIIDRQPRFNPVRLPKGLLLSKSEMRKLGVFRDIPFISPYSDFSSLKSGSNEKEKHACAVVHEILSLTVEKRTLVDHLTHFREEFRFSQQLRGMLIRHPDMFYVSLKGDRDSVFLREAYRDSQLIDKDRLLLIKEKLRSIINVPRFPRRGVRVSADDEEEEEEGGSDEFSDIENVGGDEYDDMEDDFEDGWSDEDDDDEGPPDFKDGENVRSEMSEDGRELREEKQLREKHRSIVNVSRFQRRGVRGSDEEEEGGSDEFLDIENVGGDEYDDMEDDFEDGWSDEDEENVKSKTSKDVKESREEKPREPVFPDGRPRERW